MAEIIDIPQGVTLGFGGTNARFGVNCEGDVTGFRAVDTPTTPEEFFAWMAEEALDAAVTGNEWVVAGFPGPVSPDGRHIGPFANIPGLGPEPHDLEARLIGADPAVGRLLDDGFKIIAVNDGELAAQAAAQRVGDNKYSKTAALIIGTGIGAGIVNQDPAFDNVHRADRTSPAEIGHIVISDDPTETPESTLSGPAIEARYGDARVLPAEHIVWEKVGRMAGRLSTTLALMQGAELVVVTGGVGGGASSKYGPHLDLFMERYQQLGNGTQLMFSPEVVPVLEAETQVFELYGGAGVMRDFVTRAQNRVQS